jgi:hypothetical protein
MTDIASLETAVDDALASGDESTLRSMFHTLWQEHAARTAAITSEADAAPIEHIVDLQQRVADAVEQRMATEARCAALRDAEPPRLPEAHVPKKRPTATWQGRGPVRFDV